MLSRVADAIYWMSRYLERADSTIRLIEATEQLSLDFPAEKGYSHWSALMNVSGDAQLYAERYSVVRPHAVLLFLLFDLECTNSVYSCIRGARENARIVREILSPEAWEQLNLIYHTMKNGLAHVETVIENPFEICEKIRLGSIMVSGLIEDTMPHEEAWHFFRLGKAVERADKTSRILDVKTYSLLESLGDFGSSFDDTLWAALLRSISALEPYRQIYGPVNPQNVAKFLLQSHTYPRALLFCLLSAQKTLHYFSGRPVGTFGNQAEKVVGKLVAELSYAEVDDILAQGLHEFCDTFQTQLNQLDDAIQQSYFYLSEG